jgi:hypothetical protein
LFESFVASYFHRACKFTMKTNVSPRWLAIFSLVAASLSSTSSAQTYSLGPVSASLLQSQAYTVVTDGGPASYTSLQEIPVSPSLGGQGTLNLFCLELGQEAPGGPGTPGTAEPYTILPLVQADSVPTVGQQGSVEASSGIPISGIGGATVSKLDLLYGFVFGTSYSNATSPLNINLQALGVGSISDASYGSAVFQLAAWQVTETNSFSAIASSGAFTITSPLNNGASDPGLLSDTDALLIAVSHSGAAPMNLDVLHSDSYQDYILPDPSGSFIAIPESGASSATLGVLALAYVFGRRRLQAAA